jgi:hypothetical protein
MINRGGKSVFLFGIHGHGKAAKKRADMGGGKGRANPARSAARHDGCLAWWLPHCVRRRNQRGAISPDPFAFACVVRRENDT